MRLRLLSNPWAALCLMGVLYQGAPAGHKQIYQSHEGFAKGVTDNRMQQSGFTGQKGSDFNDHYTENPSESKYGDAPEKMTANASSAIDQSAYATATRDGFNENPPFKINPNDPVYAESKFYMQNAKSVSHGTSDRYVDCQAKKKCRTTMVQHTCEKSQSASLTCHKVATAHTKKTPYTVTVKYSGQLSSATTRTGMIIPPESGTITSATVRLDNYGNPNLYLCKQIYQGFIAGVGMSKTWPDCGHGAGGLAPFSVNNTNIPAVAGTGILFKLNGGQAWGISSHRGWNITMQVTRYKDESYITWSEVIC